MELVRDYANKAFIKHKGQNMAGLKYLVEAHKHGRYRTSGVKECLKGAFGERRIFGECVERTYDVKVAVTLTTSSGYPCLVGNYNRGEPEMQGESNGNATIAPLGQEEPDTLPQYFFMRGVNQESEFRVWQACVSFPTYDYIGASQGLIHILVIY